MPRSKCFIVIVLFLAMVGFAPGDVYCQMPSRLDTIVETTVTPYNNVCFLRIKRNRVFGSAHFVSTGFFIAPNIVLTAAHNIHSAFNSKVSYIEIVPGKYFANQPYGNLVISGIDACEAAIRSHPSYKFSDGWSTRVKWDFGIIIIPQTVLAQNSVLRGTTTFILDTNYAVKPGDTIRVGGYPANPDAGYNGDFITTQQDTCLSVSAKTFRHRLETQRGNSGSPIWVERNGKKIIVGVHTFSNTATRLDRDLLALLSRWMAQAQ